MHNFCSIFILVFGLFWQLEANTQPRRALWVVRDALKSNDSIEKIFEFAQTAGISDLFVQVRALGQTYYESELEISVENINDHFDPLSIITQRAEIHNIRIHAWVNMFYVWNGNKRPLNKSHVYNTQSAFLLRHDHFPRYKQLRSEGIEGYFLDPQNLKVQNYLLNLLTEIVDKYSIAGIHLDYFRYPDVKYSFTEESRTNFMLKNYFDPLLVYMSPKKYAETHGYQVYQQADKTYRSALMRGLTSYLNEIYRVIKQKNGTCEVSIAVKPDPASAKHRYFQDWLSWLNQKICDFVVIMNYRTEWTDFIEILNQLSMKDTRRNILIGISTYNQSPTKVNTKLRAVLQNEFAGFSLFSFNHLVNNKSYINKLEL